MQSLRCPVLDTFLKQQRQLPVSFPDSIVAAFMFPAPDKPLFFHLNIMRCSWLAAFNNEKRIQFVDPVPLIHPGYQSWQKFTAIDNLIHSIALESEFMTSLQKEGWSKNTPQTIADTYSRFPQQCYYFTGTFEQAIPMRISWLLSLITHELLSSSAYIRKMGTKINNV